MSEPYGDTAVSAMRIRAERAEALNADLRAKAADAKAIAVNAMAEVARARKHACASCVREFEALEEAGLDPERSYSEQSGRIVGHHEGAAVAFGLMGMAIAIKKRQGYQEWVRIKTVQAPIRFVDVDLEDDERAF